MKKVSPKLRREVIKRANGICEYCYANSELSQDPFDVEHIIPNFVEGATVLENLALACHGCNLHKSTKTTGYDNISEETVRLFNPRIDIWNEHFAWAQEFTLIIGLTPIGRVTVDELTMNRQGLVNQRRIFYLFGKHPPKM